jgi:hypothetical protein
MFSSHTEILVVGLGLIGEVLGQTSTKASPTITSSPITPEITSPPRFRLADVPNLAEFLQDEEHQLPFTSPGEWWGSVDGGVHIYYTMDGKTTKVVQVP